MSEVILVKKYQCEECGMLSDHSPVRETTTIRRECPVCKETTTHHAVMANQVQADISASIERQLKKQA
jgi:ribosomal protein L44E